MGAESSAVTAGKEGKRSKLALGARVRQSFDMTDSAKDRAPILAAGGIVLREGSRPRIAIVRLRRGKSWVLPKGKLHPGEDALGAARREVMEETGYDVSVREFLGLMSYSVDNKIKIDVRHQGCKVAVVEAGHRNAHARTRKGVPCACGPDCAQGCQVREGLCETSLALVGQAKKHFICTTQPWIRKLN